MLQKKLLRLISLLLILLASAASAWAQQSLVPQGADWRYLDNGSDQTVVWQLQVLDDSNWQSGSAPLGYGHNDIETTVGFGGNAQQKYITTYFRHSFNVADPSLYDSLTLRLRRDDGAVVFLNGSEVFRSNLSSCGDIDYQTTALAEITGGAQTSFLEQEIVSSLLLPGNNLIAVEIHQNNPASSDLIFDLELANTARSSDAILEDGFE